MSPNKAFKVKKKHPFLKKGTIIFLIPHVYEYLIEDGDKGLEIPLEAIEHWVDMGFIKNYEIRVHKSKRNLL